MMKARGLFANFHEQIALKGGLLGGTPVDFSRHLSPGRLQDSMVKYGARGADKQLLLRCLIGRWDSTFFKTAECPHGGSAKNADAAVGVAIDNPFHPSAKRRADTRPLGEVRVLRNLAQGSAKERPQFPHSGFPIAVVCLRNEHANGFVGH
jgi:hypothetical protein